jgi:membrane protease YdiL (CAAX protease family)
MTGTGAGDRGLARRRALTAVALWVGAEFCVRTLIPVVVLDTLYPSRAVEVPTVALALAMVVPMLVVLLILGGTFDRRRRAHGLSLGDMGYRFAWPPAAAGAACGALLCLAAALLVQIDMRVFGLRDDGWGLAALVEAGAWVAPLFLLGNAVLAPVVEEFAWRGYVQTLLMTVWRNPTAIMVTGLLFAGKHLVVDLSLVRTTVLIVLSIALGVIRAHLGTLASTTAHFVLNLAASLLVVYWGPGR